MGYERNPRGTHWRGDDNGMQYQNGDYGTGRSYGSSSAREYEVSGAYDRDDERGRYGRQDRYSQNYGSTYGQSYGGNDYGRDQDRGRFGAQYGGQYGSGYSSDRGQSRYARGDEYHGSYASDGRRFEDVGDRRDWDDDNRRPDRNRATAYGYDRGRYGSRDQGRARSYGGQPEGYDYQDRGFLQRAGDEVRSWFGDDDAERRREMDSRYDEREYARRGNGDRDHDYHNWRSGQIAALDRDYDEYRQENRSKFENEFSSWRSTRQGQRDSLDKVKEHAEVVGSDGSHVGTVDKVRGDRILLTKNDADAGGQHHSIPSRWIDKVEDKKVTLSKTADEAKAQWRDEEKNQAMFRYGDNAKPGSDDTRGTGNLNRSFSGTY